MKNIVCVGVYRNMFDYVVWQLIKRLDRFDCVYIDRLRCTDISVAKYGAQNKFGKNKALMVDDIRGNKYYYHPRYKKWYKNLSENSLCQLFKWLEPGTTG